MMRRLFVMVAVLHGLLSAAAADLAEQRMLSMAVSQLQAMGIDARVEKKAETAAYAVYGTAAGGFVVLGKYADGSRVLGYSTSVYHPDRLPCGLRWWLNALDKLEVGQLPVPAAQRYNAVENFVGTQWGQDVPFNQKCPLQDNKRTPTGCIATAMAQVMRYYQWPDAGQGMGSYTVGTDTDHPVYEAVDGSYQWGNMPLVQYSFATRAAIRNAVSTLLYDCGKASKMNYNLEGSGAMDYDQALALARNFQYDSLAMWRCERSLYGDDEWMQLINAEMQARRPVLYSGASEQDGGHAFLLSGLDATGKVYVNWGWYGDCDGYYDIKALKPVDDEQEVYDFTSSQTMTIGIQPLSSEGSVGQLRSQWVSFFVADAGVSRNLRQLEIPYYYFYNVQYLPFVGAVGLLFESTDGKGISRMLTVDGMEGETVFCYEGYTNVDYSGSQPTYNPVSISLSGFPAGSYRATWVTKAGQESEPRRIVDEEGVALPPFYVTKAAGGLLSVQHSADPSGIAGVTASPADTPRYYDLQGRAVDATHPGLTIVRHGAETVVVSQ